MAKTSRVTCQTVRGRFSKYVFASLFTQDKVVCDVACGTGYGSSYLSKNARLVVGGDISENAVEYAHRKRKHNVQFLLLDALQLPFFDEAFDIIVSVDTIEHLDKYENFLGECARVLKPGGLFICATPNAKVSSFSSRKPLLRGHAKEFYIEELRYLLGNHSREIAIYGMEPQNRLDRLVFKLRLILGSKISSSAIAWKFINFVTKLVFHKYRLVEPTKSLEELAEHSGAAIPEGYQPFPLKDNLECPKTQIFVAKKM
jgi:ubiquinone/menaquinone biosynthesis C-methylase UbiE